MVSYSARLSWLICRLICIGLPIACVSAFSGCADNSVSANNTVAEKVQADSVPWYAPREDDFRREYERDAANRERQSWSGYWAYIRAFYEGNFVFSGWTKQVQAVIELVQSEQTRCELRAALNDLGKRIAAEWAKDNAVRAIDTAALREFGQRLTRAKDTEDGTGTVVRAEIEAVRAEVIARLGPQ